MIKICGWQIRRGGGEANTKKETDNKGMTLVELIVTFAVAAIFMAAAAMLVVPATKITLEVKTMNRVHDDAAIIMETIVNELSYAKPYADTTFIQLIDSVNDTSDSYYGYFQAVKYSDKGGNSAVMKVTTAEDSETVASGGKGELLIVYEAIEEEKEEEEAETTADEIRKEIDWSYGKGLYRDNEIRLGFKKKADDKNIITVRLTVTDMTSGTPGYYYEQETDVRCINVTAGNIQEETAEP